MIAFYRMSTKLRPFVVLLGLLIIVIVVRKFDVQMASKFLKPNNIVLPENLPAKTVVFRSGNENDIQGSKANQSRRWVIIFWSTVFGRVKTEEEVAYERGDCPLACELTVDQSRLSEADAFIVHARDGHMLPPTHSVPWILYTQENPVYTPVLSDPEFMSKFNLLRSYRLDSDFPNPVFGIPDLTPPVPFKEKTGLIFAVFSNCEPVRTEYMKQLMAFVQVDSYGGCLRNKYDLVDRYQTDYKSLKTELAKKYKFTLVFFNQDCDYFVDDQLIHALTAGTVPVVMGTDKLDEFLPGNLETSVIKVRDFKSPRHLADYLRQLSNNETEYSQFLAWKWKGFGNITGTPIGYLWEPDYPMYCQICVAISEGRGHTDGLKPLQCQPRAYEDWGIIPGA